MKSKPKYWLSEMGKNLKGLHPVWWTIRCKSEDQCWEANGIWEIKSEAQTVADRLNKLVVSEGK
jgi:hypothetical protein